VEPIDNAVAEELELCDDLHVADVLAEHGGEVELEQAHLLRHEQEVLHHAERLDDLVDHGGAESKVRGASSRSRSNRDLAVAASARLATVLPQDLMASSVSPLLSTFLGMSAQKTSAKPTVRGHRCRARLRVGSPSSPTLSTWKKRAA
jgi:hypothetical protein